LSSAALAARSARSGSQARRANFGEVDTRVVPLGRRQLAQRRHRLLRLGVAAVRVEGIGEAEAIFEIVREEGPEGAVDLARFLPVPLRFLGACLDGELLLLAERAGELDGFFGFARRPRVVAEVGPGLGQGGVDDRRLGVGVRGLGEEVLRPLRIEGAQVRQPLRVEAGRSGVRRPQGLGLLLLGGGRRRPAELLAQRRTGARDEVQKLGLGPDLRQVRDRFAARHLEHLEVEADPAVAHLPQREVGTDDDQIGAEHGVEALHLLRAAQSVLGKGEGGPGPGDVLAGDQAHLLAGRELGAEHLGEGVGEPGRLRVAGEIGEVEDGYRRAVGTDGRTGCRPRRERDQAGPDHIKEGHGDHGDGQEGETEDG
jgi:hypothetical protein